MSELVLPDSSALESLSDPATRIIVSMERAKSWLAEALAGDQIEQIVELKAQADAIRIYSMQKQLGKDAELSATEVVRRAERCIGLAIRKGQAEGRIAKRGDNRQTAESRYTASCKQSPYEFVGRHELAGDGTSPGIYDLADGVPDAAFESAISEAKAERNLSRANVVRKAKGERGMDRWAELERLAAAGHSSHQIAKIVGVGRDAVRVQAKKRGVVIHADRVLGRSRVIDQNRVLREFVTTLESLVPSCEMIDPATISPDVLSECIGIFDNAMRALKRLRIRLKKGDQ